MKSKIYLISLITCFILISCESDKDNDSGFSIKFSDGTIIHEKDISFYDSSTCILFLNKELYLVVGTGEPPTNCTEFSVFVNKDLIYQGVIYPDYLFSFGPPTAIYISSKTYPTFESSIIPIKGFRKIINDYRIIMSLEESNLLHHGITCSVKSLQKYSDNDSTLIATISIKNHDNINYYIPDPVKTGFKRFHYLGSGFEITNMETGNKYWPNSGYNFDLSEMTMDDLSMVESKNQIAFSYLYTYNSNIPKGLYDCYLTFGNIRHCKPITITLDQEDGRVWVGEIYSSIDNITVE